MLKRGCFIALWCLIMCGPAIADQVPVFGPKQFEKPKGKPVHYNETVAPLVSAGTYFLRVTNGDSGELEAKNVSILLNGQELIDSGDLRLNNPVVVTVDIQDEVPLEVVLKGQGGNHVTVEIFQEREAQIVVYEPSDGANVTSAIIRVVGEVSTFGLSDVGVTVNEFEAIVRDGQFFADQVVLIPGWNTVVVESLSNGTSLAKVEFQVFYEDGHQFAWLEIDEPVYIAPSVVRLDLDKFFSTPTISENLECSGPAAVEIYKAERDYEGYFETPGLYSCLAQINDAESGWLEARISFRVLELGELEEAVAQRWDSMQFALTEGDLEGALNVISARYRDRYRSVFSVLADRMARIAMNMQQLEFYKLYGNLAIFKVRKPEVHGGVEYEITHEVHFQLEADGVWRLVQL